MRQYVEHVGNCQQARAGRRPGQAQQQHRPGQKIGAQHQIQRDPRAEHRGNGAQLPGAVRDDVLDGAQGMACHPPKQKRAEDAPLGQGQAAAGQHPAVDRRGHKMHRAGQRVQPRAFLEAQPRCAVGQHHGHAGRQHRVGQRGPAKGQHRDERKRNDQAGGEDRAVRIPGQHRALHATLARIAQVRLVVEDVVDPVHQQVVREQEEERSQNQQPVDALPGNQIGRSKGVGGIHPGDGAGGGEDCADHLLLPWF